MPGPLKDYWTEFDWEAELKKDDDQHLHAGAPPLY